MTKSGCETVAHMLQVLTELDPHSTVVSVDGIGAYDHISRNAMMRGLRHVVEGDRILPFALAFYGKPSTYIWEDDVGDVHQIPHADALLHRPTPCIGSSRRNLREGERLFTYLDDLYIICQPDRVGEVHGLSQQHLWNHTRISLDSGKTKVWNRSGVEPAGCSVLQHQAELATPGAIVWRSDTALPTCKQGFKVLGVPLGHPDFVDRFLQRKIDADKVLLERIPVIPDVQAAWLILSCCASAKSNFNLRAVSPIHSGEFAPGRTKASGGVSVPRVCVPSSAPRRARFEERTQDPPCSSLGQLGQCP